MIKNVAHRRRFGCLIIASNKFSKIIVYLNNFEHTSVNTSTSRSWDVTMPSHKKVNNQQISEYELVSF